MSEPDILQKKPRKRGRLLVFAALTVLILCFVPSGWNYYRVAAVQNTLARNWEIAFGKEGRPDAMPKILDDKVEVLLGDKENRWGEQIPSVVYRERVRAMFRGRIEEIHIYYHEGFRGDLGAALLRFPELKKVTVTETDPNNADYKLLCTRLRQLPALEELVLGDERLVSDALTPLAGHPKLRKLVIRHSCNLSTDVLETFKRLPALKVLEVGDLYGVDIDKWKSPSFHEQFHKELPGVTITLPKID